MLPSLEVACTLEGVCVEGKSLTTLPLFVRGEDSLNISYLHVFVIKRGSYMYRGGIPFREGIPFRPCHVVLHLAVHGCGQKLVKVRCSALEFVWVAFLFYVS